ncbi:MAG: hypothetical protein JNL82_26970 [Myxococcales bacterium]|jgi:hypothetical protein|nr:hypothetical protein [Myxococcales bacterium]
MQPRTRSAKFVRSLVDAATVRPMLSALLEMKRARMHSPVVQVAPVQPLPVEVPLKAA